ncbi:hypothetical protein SUGI_0753280 [Cryptomeria japonica]|nr:hypothetical protein SUGI_0753280 [Cryptomeria japonica]
MVAFPFQLENLPTIKAIYLSSNILQGNFFLTSFQNMTTISTLDLSYNELTITIEPDWIPSTVHFYTVYNLDISNNSLFGNVPDWLGILPHLAYLSLSHNILQGLVPSSLKISDFYQLDLHGNLNLQLLDLSQNEFMGSIAVDIGNLLPTIEILSFSGNNLSGDIPSSIDLLQQLDVLDLSKNKLFGKIPSSITNCSTLTRLNLANNGFIGEIPYHIRMLSSLSSLHLNENMLKGNLPSSLKNCSRLQILDLADNLFFRNIPIWLGQFSELMILVLRSNKFGGRIPHQLSNLSSLHVLDVSHNSLIGVIPPQLAELKGMRNSTLGSSHDNGGSFYYYKEEIQVFNKGLEMVYKFSDVTYNLH